MSELISYDEIKRYLNRDLPVFVFESLKSTNLTAKEYAIKGAAEGSIVVALSQTGGRGRLGRQFFSPKGSGIYLSVILRPDFSPEDITLITASAAVAVCNMIEKMCNKKPQIKWVNDIFLDNKKVCGILSEGVFSADGKRAEYIILGIGINLFVPDGGFPEDIERIAGGIFEKNDKIDLNLIIAETVKEFLRLYDNLHDPEIVKSYRNRLMLMGKTVNYIKNGVTESGKVLDIDHNFRLIIEKASGETEALQSGEVTIKSSTLTRKD